MSVLSEAASALDLAGVTGWQRELAVSLAGAMDEAPNASTAKELRVLMLELVGERRVEAKDVADDLAAKRAARRAASS